MVERVLIVDDDLMQRRLVENLVCEAGYETTSVDGGDAALRMMLATASAPYDCVVLALAMPDLDGLGVLGRMRDAGLEIPVIVQVDHRRIDNVISAMRAGAADFVVKPVGIERLSVTLRNALAARALASEIARQKHSRSGILTFRDIVARTPNMRAVLCDAEKAAASTMPVLIEGESGVGKELIARAIHGSGERRTKPFVAVNCRALPENHAESILFGRQRGAFANPRHDGKFAEASGGTLFLDEVRALPPAAQVKLLQAIRDGAVQPVERRKPIKTNVRIVSATDRELIGDVRSGRFNQDLFHHLQSIPIMVPPLRERAEDIPELVCNFLARFAAEEGKRIQCVSVEAMQMLHRYSWPGNVRQLENTIFRAVALAEGKEITIREFPQLAARIGDFDAGDGRTQAPAHAMLVPSDDIGAQQLCESQKGFASGVPYSNGDDNSPEHAVMPAAPADGSGSMLNLLNDGGNVRALEDIEADVIRFALAHYRGQISEVARRLRIGRSTLYRKLEMPGLEMTTTEQPTKLRRGDTRTKMTRF